MAKVGRPKLYTHKFLSQIGKELLTWMRQDENYYLKDFCTDKPYSNAQMSRWTHLDRQFGQTLKKAKEIQETKIVKYAMSEKNNPSFSKFVLKNIAGWRDVRDNTEIEEDKTELWKSIAIAIAKQDTKNANQS